MKICEIGLKSITPYSQSRLHESPKFEKEKPDEYEARTWKEKGTFNEAGEVCIPAMALKMSIDEAVKRLGLQVPGRGKTTYSKFFVAGQICESDVPIGVHKDDVQPIKIWANADGVRGSGKRVKRIFPVYPKWSGTARFAILDESIPKDIFERAVIEAGRLIGIGRFRPEKGGFNGRFAVEKFSWSEV